MALWDFCKNDARCTKVGPFAAPLDFHSLNRSSSTQVLQDIMRVMDEFVVLGNLIGSPASRHQKNPTFFRLDSHGRRGQHHRPLLQAPTSSQDFQSTIRPLTKYQSTPKHLAPTITCSPWQLSSLAPTKLGMQLAELRAAVSSGLAEPPMHHESARLSASSSWSFEEAPKRIGWGVEDVEVERGFGWFSFDFGGLWWFYSVFCTDLKLEIAGARWVRVVSTFSRDRTGLELVDECG